MSNREQKRVDALVQIAQQKLDGEAECRASAGQALAKLKEDGGYSKMEWDAFCRERLTIGSKPLSGRHADRLIAFAKLKADLGPMGPKNERQGRALGRLPKHLQGPAIDAVTADGPATGERIEHLVRKAMGSKTPEDVIEESKQQAKQRTSQRRQDSEATQEQRRVARVRKKLDKLRVITVGEARGAFAASRPLVGIVDLDRVDVHFGRLLDLADEVASEAAAAIDALDESAALAGTEETAQAA